MIQLFILGDLHFKTTNSEETEFMSASILSEINSRKCDGIVVLGDILDRHANINSSVLTRAVKFLDNLRKISKLYVLIGNHDLKSNDQFFSEDHPFMALKFWENTVLIDKSFSDVINGEKLVFCPYVPCGRFNEALSHLSEGYEDASCIFAHQEFKGANLGCQISTLGDDWEISNPYVISGHIHDYQELGPNILYMGTPIQHTYSDSLLRYIGYAKIENSKVDVEKIILKNIIKKKIIKLFLEDLENYEVEIDPMMRIKAKIKCELNQPALINKHVKIIRMVKAGYKISYEIITKNGIQSDDKNIHLKSFSELLLDNLKSNKNKRLYQVYNSIILK